MSVYPAIHSFNSSILIVYYWPANT